MPGGGPGGSPRKPLAEMPRWELVGDLLLSSGFAVGWIGLFSYWAWESFRAESGVVAAACAGLAVFGGVWLARFWAAHAAERRRRGRAGPPCGASRDTAEPVLGSGSQER
jgi:hypothetical protein